MRFLKESGTLLKTTPDQMLQAVRGAIAADVKKVQDEGFDFSSWDAFLRKVRIELAEEIRVKYGFKNTDRILASSRYTAFFATVCQELENQKIQSLKNRQLILEGKLKSQKQVEKERRAEEERREREKENLRIEKLKSEATSILDANGDLVEKFLDISFRNVTKRDDYGHERPEELEKQIEVFLKKVLLANGFSESDVNGFREYARQRQKGVYFPKKNGMHLHSIPGTYEQVRTMLRERFQEFYQSKKSGETVPTVNIETMTGVEFEQYLANCFEELGYLVNMTPTTGDQGCDLLLEKNGRKIAVQAKRYSANVGNKAIQQVVAAKTFYHAQACAVVTNSMFTRSAMQLAEANEVMLVDGEALRHLGEYF